jgi:hypothetical protein
MDITASVRPGEEQQTLIALRVLDRIFEQAPLGVENDGHLPPSGGALRAAHEDRAQVVRNVHCSRFVKTLDHPGNRVC